MEINLSLAAGIIIGGFVATAATQFVLPVVAGRYVNDTGVLALQSELMEVQKEVRAAERAQDRKAIQENRLRWMTTAIRVKEAVAKLHANADVAQQEIIAVSKGEPLPETLAEMTRHPLLKQTIVNMPGQ